MAGAPRRRARREAGVVRWSDDPSLSTRPPFEVGNQVARRHGVWSADVDDEAVEVVGLLYDPEVAARYPAMALLGAQVWVRLRRALADIDERGMVVDTDGGVREHPLTKYLHRWEGTLLDLSDRFGLDPRAEAALLRQRADAEHSIVDLDAIRVRGRQALAARGLDVGGDGVA